MNDEKPEPCTDEARDAGCTCRLSTVNSATIDPPEPVLDEWCPVHGRDPDWELQKRRDEMRAHYRKHPLPVTFERK